MEEYLKLSVVNLLHYVKDIDVNMDLKKQINDLYNQFECCDFDLYNYDINNKYEKQIKQIVEFYYNNIEEIINDFSNNNAIQFVCELKELCLVDYDDIIEYLEQIQ